MKSPRPYQLRQRKEKQEATRQRIVEATAALHEEIGPRATTISAVALRAGVERLTVYRHFPTEAALLQGCSSHWVAHHPPPDPAEWAAEADPEARLRRALSALYAYFEASERMLASVHQDLAALPELARVTQPFLDYLAGVSATLARDWPGPDAGRVLRAVVGFPFWQQLHAAGATPTSAKVHLVVVWLTAFRRPPEA